MNPMPETPLTDAYAQTGVRTTADAPEFQGVIDQIRSTFAFRVGEGRPVLDLGYYANVLRFGDLGIAVSMDGVGTKVVLASQTGDFRSIGIDLIAMNVNDLLCVGADPVALLDYIAIDTLDSPALPALALSLVEGARLAGISIPGGEVAQVKELLAPHGAVGGFDIVGTALGVVPIDRIQVGAAITPGDVVIGIASTGLHSNGYTLARRVLLAGGWDLDTVPAELGHSLAEELLIPTAIYVPLLRALWAAGIPLHGAFHITGEGLLNLLRHPTSHRIVIDHWPEPPPIFGLIASRGGIDPSTMFTTFNMGVGFVLITSEAHKDAALECISAAGWSADVLGRVEGSTERGLRAPALGLESRGGILTQMARIG